MLVEMSLYNFINHPFWVPHLLGNLHLFVVPDSNVPSNFECSVGVVDDPDDPWETDTKSATTLGVPDTGTYSNSSMNDAYLVAHPT